MNESANRTRVLIIQTLEKAQIVLKELLMTSLQNDDSDMKSTVNDAEEKIDQTLQNELALEQSAEQIEYDELIQKLRASEMKLSPEVIARMDDF